MIDNLSQLEDGFFGGSIKLQENSVLNGNVTVKGSLSVGKNAGINLNGYSLTAGGMVLDYGSRFIMNKKKVMMFSFLLIGRLVILLFYFLS